MIAENNRLHVFFSGRVQGVFFRMYTRETAPKLGVSGFVKNLPDGRVEVVAEGKKDALNVFLDKLLRYRGADIKSRKVVWESPTCEFKNFEIRYNTK